MTESTLPPASAPVVGPDSFLTLHYRVGSSDDQAEEFVSTYDMSPATLQMGGGQLAATLENCLLGMTAGETRVFELPPEAAFGAHNPRLVEWIARSALPPEIELKESSLVEFSGPEGGGFAGFLRELTPTSACFDFNHPLAGRHIRFEVRIIGVM